MRGACVNFFFFGLGSSMMREKQFFPLQNASERYNYVHDFQTSFEAKRPLIYAPMEYVLDPQFVHKCDHENSCSSGYIEPLLRRQATAR